MCVHISSIVNCMTDSRLYLIVSGRTLHNGQPYNLLALIVVDQLNLVIRIMKIMTNDHTKPQNQSICFVLAKYTIPNKTSTTTISNEKWSQRWFPLNLLKCTKCTKWNCIKNGHLLIFLFSISFSFASHLLRLFFFVRTIESIATSSPMKNAQRKCVLFCSLIVNNVICFG